jgi:predicted DNA-binding ribbon-helix-helix protein
MEGIALVRGVGLSCLSCSSDDILLLQKRKPGYVLFPERTPTLYSTTDARVEHHGNYTGHRRADTLWDTLELFNKFMDSSLAGALDQLKVSREANMAKLQCVLRAATWRSIGLRDLDALLTDSTSSIYAMRISRHAPIAHQNGNPTRLR